ncbi:MAG TPA: dihydroorotate dehydrogenase electron transfer subunit [Mariprofundaceae bacterium]|nr:dihydroorotate dehydrogenase electron transfer subunit [Mariprofundaceae bacterium]
MAEPYRNTIFEEAARIIANAAHPEGQFILRLAAPKIAASAQPGQFVHLRVSDERPMRRPLSIMQTDADKGTVDILVKIVGEGTGLLAQRKAGETLACMGPIGRPFDLTDTSRRYVLIGGGVGIPPMIFAAQRLRGRAEIVVFAGSEVPFPFALKPSGFMLPGINGNTILGIASLEDWGVASRLASNAGLYGCFSGYVPDLARAYLEALDAKERRRTVLLSCGPHPMLHAVARLGRELGIPAQLSLEEHMACGLGGCAGCVVKTIENEREYYRRVCVDGPVFPADILPEFA